jgi:tellurite resistance protein
MVSMLDALNRDERMLLLRFVCGFAWTDREVKAREQSFVERLTRRLGLDAADTAEVRGWLHVAPTKGSLDPSSIPLAHRRAFVEAARAMIYADGDGDAEERAELEKLEKALAIS